MPGILCRPKQVEILGMSEDSSENYIGFLDGMKERYGSLPSEISAIPGIILKKVEAGHNFKRDIVMYIVSTMSNYPHTRKCR